MDKLQYDSFYKFMVSVGVVLIAAPLLGLYYLLCNGNQILITKAEFEALSSTSMIFVQQRDQTILYILKALPWILCILILIGLACLIYGGLKWHNIQKEIDEQTKLKTRAQKFNVEKMTASEIATKAIEEASDEQEEQVTVPTEISLEKTRVLKGIEIENLCYTYIHKQHSRSYDIQQNVKLGNYGCDIVAVSKIDKTDYIFEIKYWKGHPNTSLFYRVTERMESMKTTYENISQRGCKCILMIVTLEENKENMQACCNRYINDHPVSFDIRVNTEEDLKNRVEQ